MGTEAVQPAEVMDVSEFGGGDRWRCSCQVSAMASQGGRPMNILVWGEAGDGKSTLINKLAGSEGAKVGKNPNGVTKELTPYFATIHGEVPVYLWDMPGAGDIDV